MSLDPGPRAVPARRARLLADPAPRPPEFYDPTTPPYRDEQGVHLFDHATIRGLLRDPQRVTSDVSELLTPGLRDRLHPVSCFVWATDRRTMSGCPGRHAALRSVMAPWFAAGEAAARQAAARPTCERTAARLAGRPFDVYLDYALPVAVGYLADWVGVDPAHVRYAIDDQVAAGNMFDEWPPLAPPGMDERYRTLLARPDLYGIAATTRELLRCGVFGEREAWGIVYSLAVSGVATATAIALTVGLAVEHGLWPRMADPGYVGRAVEEAVRLGSPFPQASRFARESFIVGDLVVERREQVLMWLTAANRGLPGPHRQPLDRFDPERDNTQHLGWGAGYHACGGVHHARALAAAAVTALARRFPELGIAAPWTRFVGIDDGYTAAPVVPQRTGGPSAEVG
jgi:cytochrome P450